MYQRKNDFLTSPGATLIELLLSLSLSILLLGLFSLVYWTRQEQNEGQNAMAAMHEHAFFVMQKLKFEIQMAGFIGCPRLRADFPLNNTTRFYLSPNNKIEVRQDRQASMIMTIRHRSVQAALLREAQHQASQLVLSAELQVVPGELLLISDCKQADLFEVDTVSKQPEGQMITTRHPLHDLYPKNAEIGRFEMNTYSVERTRRHDEHGQALFAFYLTDVQGHKTELVDGIEKIKIELTEKSALVAVKARQKNQSKTEYTFVTFRNA